MLKKQVRLAGSAVRAIWRSAEPLIAAALGAHIAILVLTQLAAPVPLLTALVATLVFAGIGLAYAFRGRMIVLDVSVPRQLLAGLVSLVVIGVGVWLLRRLSGAAAAFYCLPLVPWRIEIALFGSFTVGCLHVMARARRRGWIVYPAVMISLLWIAPFYGFFSAPLFLGISLSTVCPDRPITAVLITAFGMIVGEQLGRAVAEWLSGGHV